MAVLGAFYVIFAATFCLTPADCIPGDLNGLFGAALNVFPVYEKLADYVNSAASWADNVHQNTNDAIGSVKSNVKSMMGQIDGPTLVKLIEPKLNKDDIYFSQCLKGVRVMFEGTAVDYLNMYKGIVTFEDTKFQIVGSYEDEDLGDYQILKILFQFTDLEIAYKLAVHRKIGGSTEGFIIFRFEGISSLIVTVKVPSDVKKVKEMASGQNCFLDIQQVLSEMSGYVKKTDSNYDSLLKEATGFGIVGDFSIEKLASDFESLKVLKKNTAEALFFMVKPILTNQKVFCSGSQFSEFEAPKTCGWGEVHAIQVLKGGLIEDKEKKLDVENSVKNK